MNKRNQPYIEIIPNRTDQTLDVIGWILLALLIGLSVYLISMFPKESHDVAYVFGFLGIITYVIFHFLKRHPHRFNYLVKITPQNAQRQYSLALRMIRVLNLFLLIEFIVILTVMYLGEIKGKETDEGLLVVAVMTLGFIPLVFFLWKMSSR